MRDLIKPYFDEYLKHNITLTDLSNTLLNFDITIDFVGVDPFGVFYFTFSDNASDAVYTWEIK